MAAKKPVGRPKRPEALKKIYLRQSVHAQWRSKKDSLGYSKLMDSEFAEVLLQLVMTVPQSYNFYSQVYQGRMCKKC